MAFVFLILHIAICSWILFMDGAEQIEGSWLTALMFLPGMEAREIRVFAALSLVVWPITLII